MMEDFTRRLAAWSADGIVCYLIAFAFDCVHLTLFTLEPVPRSLYSRSCLHIFDLQFPSFGTQLAIIFITALQPIPDILVYSDPRYSVLGTRDFQLPVDLLDVNY